MAAIVSSTWCLVFSATAAGSGLRSADAMYALTCCITGEMSVADLLVISSVPVVYNYFG
jgi:hypothetical protein